MRRRLHAAVLTLALATIAANAFAGDLVPAWAALLAAATAPLALLGVVASPERLPGAVLAALYVLAGAVAFGVPALHAEIVAGTIAPPAAAVALALLLVVAAVAPGVILSVSHARRGHRPGRSDR